MKKRLYLAYGSNLNLEQMSYRCPDATVLGTAELKDYELLFKGSGSGSYLTVERRKGATVPLGVWEVSEADERALDRYEGCPRFYYKKTLVLPVTDAETGETRRRRCFIYIMHEDRKLGVPSMLYWRTCHRGYRDFGFDPEYLKQALNRTPLHTDRLWAENALKRQRALNRKKGGESA